MRIFLFIFIFSLIACFTTSCEWYWELTSGHKPPPETTIAPPPPEQQEEFTQDQAIQVMTTSIVFAISNFNTPPAVKCEAAASGTCLIMTERIFMTLLRDNIITFGNNDPISKSLILRGTLKNNIYSITLTSNNGKDIFFSKSIIIQNGNN